MILGLKYVISFQSKELAMDFGKHVDQRQEAAAVDEASLRRSFLGEPHEC